ncbi:hypothetical protein Syun_020285 [Stephania yunnanensis]|uniref:Transcription termination factor MTERF5, chloroplastic n=1 Tax=Stephania yunnanensis TaxID=152371 RepID=A0AAP0IDP0_9MAGN
MKAWSTFQTLKLPFSPIDAFATKRIRICFPQLSISCRAGSSEAVLGESVNLTMASSTVLTAEKEEAKAVLTLFLREQGLSNLVAARTINKSENFIDHLISKLHSVHKTRYLVGRELSTLEIREALVPYLDSLFEEHGDVLVNVVENFPGPSAKEADRKVVTSSNASLHTKKLRAMARVSEISSEGKLPPHIRYLVNLGMELDQIKKIVRKFPAFAYYSLDGKIKPVVEFLLNLGVPQSDIPFILKKRPQLCGISLSDNLIPTMAYLEGWGVDKTQWAKVIYRFPALLTYSRQKLTTTLAFLHEEVGISKQSIGKILTRCPHIISYHIEDNLRPTIEYFSSMGVDVAFFSTVRRLYTMISRYGALYTFSLEVNLIPKWEFFLTMDYPSSELVKFPQYFGYSLEERIKPRYALVRESGVKLLLNQVLSLSKSEFETTLKKKLKLQDRQATMKAKCLGDLESRVAELDL